MNIYRTLYKYGISHNISWFKHLPMAADQELADDQLPAGHTPVWIEPAEDATQVQMLERVETMAGQYQDVIVLYYNNSDERAAAWCEERGWQYHDALNIYGCEAQCVVLLQCPLSPEWITRGRNMLIILREGIRNKLKSFNGQI